MPCMIAQVEMGSPLCLAEDSAWMRCWLLNMFPCIHACETDGRFILMHLASLHLTRSRTSASIVPVFFFCDGPIMACKRCSDRLQKQFVLQELGCYPTPSSHVSLMHIAVQWVDIKPDDISDLASGGYLFIEAISLCIVIHDQCWEWGLGASPEVLRLSSNRDSGGS